MDVMDVRDKKCEARNVKQEARSMRGGQGNVLSSFLWWQQVGVMSAVDILQVMTSRLGIPFYDCLGETNN